MFADSRCTWEIEFITKCGCNKEVQQVLVGQIFWILHKFCYVFIIITITTLFYKL